MANPAGGRVNRTASGPPLRSTVTDSGGGGAPGLGAYQKIRWNWSPRARKVGATVEYAVTGCPSSVFTATRTS
jgi:hypothetical protein